jgi:hypothetical protein
MKERTMKMMKKAGWMVMGALAVSTMLPGVAFADRSTSLQGNRLIEDADDVFTYPHLVTKYKDRVSFDFGTSAAQGNGLFLMDGGSFTWGVALHRGNIFDASSVTRLNELNALNILAIPALPGYVPAAPAPLTIADVMFGFGDLGFRLSLGTGGDSTTPPGNAGETSNSTTYGNLALSFGGVENWDLGLHLGLLMSDSVAGGDTISDGSQFRAAATARGFMPMNEMTRLGVLGRLGFITQSTDNTAANTTTNTSASQFDLVVGVGPSIQLTDRANIGAYATLGFQTANFDPSDRAENDSSSGQAILLPGANVAMEIMLTSWLRARAGMEYNHAFTMGSQLSAAGETTTSSNVAGFNWNAGIGIVYDSFRLDGTFNPSFLTQGPDFIGGDGPLFAMLSASYLFGEAAAAPVAAPTAEEQPMNKPPREEYRPAPAPVVESAPPSDSPY